jgi:hypothetical protein
MRISFLIGAALLAGCGGNRSASVSPDLSAAQMVQAFMRAAADSNLVRMGDLWGNEKGPANLTHFPPEYEKRLAVMQVYLRGDSARVVSDMAVRGSANQRQLSVELHRGTCVMQIPMTAVRSGKGWLLETVDISAAGNPVRPCGVTP